MNKFQKYKIQNIKKKYNKKIVIFFETIKVKITIHKLSIEIRLLLKIILS